VRSRVTEADVKGWLLDSCPNVVDELNQCSADVYLGRDRRPGRGWDGWIVRRVPLDFALKMCTEGEA
jgi:hypothetical protein